MRTVKSTSHADLSCRLYFSGAVKTCHETVFSDSGITLNWSLSYAMSSESSGLRNQHFEETQGVGVEAGKPVLVG